MEQGKGHTLMRNVYVVSFADKIIDAGFQRIKPREETVMQYDLLYPYAMHYNADNLAIANIERVAEHVGQNADKAFLKSLFWIFPTEAEKPKGAPSFKAAAKAAPKPEVAPESEMKKALREETELQELVDTVRFNSAEASKETVPAAATGPGVPSGDADPYIHHGDVPDAATAVLGASERRGKKNKR